MAQGGVAPAVSQWSQWMGQTAIYRDERVFCSAAAAPIGPNPHTPRTLEMDRSAQYERDMAVIRNRREAEIEQARADLENPQLRGRAKELGLEITFSEKSARGIVAALFQFWRSTQNVAKYYPAIGFVYIAGGSRRNVPSLADALEFVAEKVGPPKPGERRHGPQPAGQSQRKHRDHPVGTADRPEPRQRGWKPAKHNPRKGSTHAGDVKILYSMLRGAIRRCRKNRPAITSRDIQTALADLAETFVKT